MEQCGGRSHQYCKHILTNFAPYLPSKSDAITPSYTPSICGPFLSFIPVIVNFPNLTPRVRELAVLATASNYKAPFVLHAHTAIAQSVGLSSEQVAAASAGKLPGGLDAAETAAWGFALRLATTPGPLNPETWDQARSCLGIEGVANLAHVVGAYAHMCLYQNAADIDWHGGYNM